MKNLHPILVTGYYESRRVKLNGELLDPRESQRIVNHSPDGFAWGYAGSGPAQLALAICIKLYGIEKALETYQEFKHKYIATLPQQSFSQVISVEL